jgi:thiamine-phosphate diphosphorylase
LALIPRVIGISPGADGTPRDIQSFAEAASRGGMDGLILRETQLSERQLVSLARQLAPWLGAGLILHARHPAAIEIAAAAGWGLHLPSDMDPTRLRDQIRGPLGMSCHSVEALLAAATAGCDYALLSPIFPPRSKPDDTREALGTALLGQATAALGMPIIALGGITVSRAAACIAAGAHGIASMGGLFGPEMSPEETQAAAQALRAAMPRD